MRLILARIIYDFDLKLAEDSKHWIERQKAFPLVSLTTKSIIFYISDEARQLEQQLTIRTQWDRIPLNVYLTPVSSK